MDKITRVSKNCLSMIEEFECGGNFRNFITAYKLFSTNAADVIPVNVIIAYTPFSMNDADVIPLNVIIA